MDISFELYKVFYHVASTLSFSEASRQLFISQSAVSQSVKSLEQKLGHPLFVRNTKKVELTPEGETLFRQSPCFFRVRTSSCTQLPRRRLCGSVPATPSADIFWCRICGVSTRNSRISISRSPMPLPSDAWNCWKTDRWTSLSVTIPIQGSG